MTTLHRSTLLLTPLVAATTWVTALAQSDGGLTPAPHTPSVPSTSPAPLVLPAPGVASPPRETPPPSDAPPRSISPKPGLPIAKGTVTRLLPNAEGAVDGLMLGDGTQIRFPPHMTQELASAVKPGSAVSVEGYREAGGVVRARVITDQSSGRSVVERDPAPASSRPESARGAAPAPLSAEGRIQQLVRDPAGDVNGLVLEDGSVVRFPPNVRRQFPGVLQPGVSVTASGYGAQTRFGRALDATSLGASDKPAQPGR